MKEAVAQFLASPSSSASIDPSTFSTGSVNKRCFEQTASSPTPSAKKRKGNPLDGAVLPWPVSIVDFEDLIQLRLIREDLSRFTKIVNGKITKLKEALRPVEAEDDDDELDPKDKAYWADQLADLTNL
jgi:hypothetical protein